MNILKKFFEKKERQKINFFIVVIIILIIFNIFLLFQNYNLNKKLEIKEKQEKQIKISRNFFPEKINLKDYKNTRYKINFSGKKIIENIRELHKIPVLISKEFQNKELCAGFIAELSKKIWGNKVIYSIGMQNTKKGKLAQAWELAYFYEAFGGKILIDLGKKFSLEKKDYLDKIGVSNLKEFFAKAFSEQALFGDIGFLYSKTKYIKFLKGWNANSHITKNMGISNFEIIISKFDKNKSNLENFLNNLGCSKEFFKYIDLLENYKLYLNGKQIVFYNKDFYYLENGNILGKKVNFKYLDRIIYKDVIIAHFFKGKSQVDSLFQFSCKMNFYPINIININSRMIEKM